MKDVTIAITAASYSGNKGAAAMLQSSIKQLKYKYGEGLTIKLMSVYPKADKEQLPFEFIEIVSCKPEQLLFVTFPIALLYGLFRWCAPIRKILEKNKIIKAYTQTDMVIDEAGISFVDSRGFVMNTYAFVSVLVPLLTKTPVVKYSQALGEFKNFFNRTYAKLILPKMDLICARGEITYANLQKIGITKNVELCADGAFSMPDDEKIADDVKAIYQKDTFYNDKVIGLSVSSVVEKKCNKMGIPYQQTMIEFADYLIEQGYRVLIIANAARTGSDKPRNNDLMICQSVYDGIKNKEEVRWYTEEMTAEKIRELISCCRVLVASRFHAMIGALYKEVPVLLIGWSHKYKEVLDMFELGSYAVDFSKLDTNLVIEGFEDVIKHEQEIRTNVAKNLEKVQESSRKNIQLITDKIDKHLNNKGLFDFNNIEKYIGQAKECRMGYSNDDEIRMRAASGGMVTTILCSLLKQGEIEGAWVTKSVVENGQLTYKTGIAMSEEEIRDCSSSVYMDIPLLKHLPEIEKFEGKIAVVLLPCQMRGFQAALDRNAELKQKVVLKICLYCSGEHSKEATILPLKNKGILLENAKKVIYRNGHWRGVTRVINQDGTEQKISYGKSICAYKNAYFFSQERCMLCQDQYGYASDLSFGDVWLKEMKKEDIKYTSCIIRTEEGRKLYHQVLQTGAITDKPLSRRKMLMSQKRALVFKWNCAKAKQNLYKKQGKTISLDTSSKCKWNHKLAYLLAHKNREYSLLKQDKMVKIPNILIYYYMAFIRVLLSF